MTDEQIALIKYAIRAENKKTAQVLGKLKVPVDDYESPLAKALRAALALAEQARAMEGYEVTRYSFGEVEIYKSDRGWTVLYKKKHLWLTNDGIWIAAIGKAKFFTRPHQALTAANAAMKAGDK